MIETRDIPRRAQLVLFALLGLAAAAVAPTTSHAAGGVYTAHKCYNAAGAAGGTDGGIAATAEAGYQTRNLCLSELRYVLDPVGNSPRGNAARLRFLAPAGTTIAGFHLDVDGRTADGHFAEVYTVGWDGAATLLYRAPNQPGGYNLIGPHSGNWSEVQVALSCQNTLCPPSTNAHAWVRNVVVFLRDLYDPWLTGVGGGLLNQPSWIRGSHSLSASAADAGAGLSALRARVNGALVADAAAPCPGNLGWPSTNAFVPCGSSAGFQVNVDTGSLQNGANEVVIHAEDYSGNTTIARQTIRVDNKAPAVEFTNEQSPDDGELIRAPAVDEHSGLDPATVSIAVRPVGGSAWQGLETKLRDGALETRVDSASFPAGNYEFRASVRDGAGNTSETTRRNDGEPMRLAFPLRREVKLDARLEPSGAAQQTAHYGEDSFVAGRLRDGADNPLAGQKIRVVESFGDGALIRERVSNVETDAEGKWSSKLPAGPSREVTAYYEGTQRYLSEQAKAGRLGVRSRISFERSRERVSEGESVVFKGKVGRRAAKIPVGGKLVEVLVRVDKGRWETVKRPLHTNGKGRFMLGYRFRKFYAQDTLYAFRARVIAEGDWPYKGKRSKVRKVVVVAS